MKEIKRRQIAKNIEVEEYHSEYRVFYKKVFVGYVGYPSLDNILGNTIGDYTDIINRYNQKKGSNGNNKNKQIC